MNVNYDRLFEQEKARLSGTPKLLLHVCCAPCATYCLTQVIDAFDVTLLYSNDNITARAEWDKRLAEVRKLVDIVNSGKFVVAPKAPVKLAVKEADPAEFFAVSRGLENEKEGGARCAKCFAMRLQNAQNYAAVHGYDYFATTLTVSPYKNSRLLNEIGLDLQTDLLKWLPSDFKKRGGYNESIRLCAQYGIYRQHYCGCCYSLAEASANN